MGDSDINEAYEHRRKEKLVENDKRQKENKVVHFQSTRPKKAYENSTRMINRPKMEVEKASSSKLSISENSFNGDTSV